MVIAPRTFHDGPAAGWMANPLALGW